MASVSSLSAYRASNVNRSHGSDAKFFRMKSKSIDKAMPLSSKLTSSQLLLLMSCRD